MKEIADKMGVNLSKIENWYKHNRRMLSKNGSFYLKVMRLGQIIINIIKSPRNILKRVN